MREIIQGGINPIVPAPFSTDPIERTSVTGKPSVEQSRWRAAPPQPPDLRLISLLERITLGGFGVRVADGRGGAAFGRVVYGIDVVGGIQQQRCKDKPYAAVPMVSVRSSNRRNAAT